MDISAEDALSVMDRWRDASSLVTACLRVGGSFGIVRGTVSIVDYMVSISSATAQVSINVSDAQRIVYGDWRVAPASEQSDAKRSVDSVLYLELPNGTVASIFAAP
jgi:hypothetical protein